MKQFFKYFFASVLAGLFLFFLIFVIIVMVSPEKKPLMVKADSVLHIDMQEAIGELTYSKPNLTASGIEDAGKLGVRDITQAIHYATTDKKIKGIYLDVSSINAGMATAEEVRNSLKKFKASGKFIIAYSELYTKGGYYMASLADEIYMYPTGMLEWNGLGSEKMFFKKALEKLDVDVQIIRGSNNKFKSAVEPFFLEKMSESNRLQTEKFVNSFWDHIVNEVSVARNITSEQLNLIADDMLIYNAQSTVDQKFVDALKFEDQVVNILKEKVGVAKGKDLASIKLRKYVKYATRKQKIKKLNKENIAIVYATGEIRSGKGDIESIGSETTAKLVREARLNDSIKAVVLRVNSPGGSALASDVIWREIQLTKAKKPVVVSMGDVAASGGYYIACAADRIFAQPNTITGSIGVFGMVPNMERMLEDKVGITIDRVQTNKHANIMSVTKALSDEEYKLIQQGVDEIYDDFITKVSLGRGMTKEQVDSIGQGRVWTGTDALEINLVDEIGGLDKAIAHAAKLANIEKPFIMQLPKQKENPLEEFLEALSQGEEDQDEGIMSVKYTNGKTSIIDNLMKYVDELNHISNTKADQIQARLPYDIQIN